MNRYNSKVTFFGLLVIAASVAVTVLIAGWDIFKEVRYWHVFGPLLLAEVLVFFPWIRLSGKSTRADFPARTATAYLPFFYLVFTVLMMVTYPAGVPVYVICILQIIGLLAVTGLFLFLSFLTDAVKENTVASEAANAQRMNFRLVGGTFKAILEKRFAGDKEFAKQLTALQNRIRWAAETVPGQESWDTAAAEKVEAVARAAAEKDKEEIINLMQQAEITLIQREEALKLAR